MEKCGELCGETPRDCSVNYRSRSDLGYSCVSAEWNSSTTTTSKRLSNAFQSHNLSRVGLLGDMLARYCCRQALLPASEVMICHWPGQGPALITDICSRPAHRDTVQVVHPTSSSPRILGIPTSSAVAHLTP